jgi:hypothetical protein
MSVPAHYPAPPRMSQKMARSLAGHEKYQGPLESVICFECGSGDDDAYLLLCERCNAGCHLACAKPKLYEVPMGDWYCHMCASQQTPLPDLPKETYPVVSAGVAGDPVDPVAPPFHLSEAFDSALGAVLSRVEGGLLPLPRLKEPLLSIVMEEVERQVELVQAQHASTVQMHAATMQQQSQRALKTREELDKARSERDEAWMCVCAHEQLVQQYDAVVHERDVARAALQQTEQRAARVHEQITKSARELETTRQQLETTRQQLEREKRDIAEARESMKSFGEQIINGEKRQRNG